MEQIIGNVGYSPDYHSTPLSHIIPDGTVVIPDNNLSQKAVASFDKEYYITKVRKVLKEFLENMDELENSEVLKCAFTNAVDSYIRNQQYFLTEQFTQKITDIFLCKEQK